jgi:folate-binding protein YgfZ
MDLNNTPKISFYNLFYKDLQFDVRKNVVTVYENLIDEYKTLYSGVGIRDISHFGVMELQGKNSLDFLHRVSTNSLKELQPYNSDVTLFTNEKGRIIERTTVMNFNESVLLIGSDYFKQKLFSWINKYIILEDIKAVDLSGQFAIYELMGQQVDSFSTLIFDNDIDRLKINQIKNYIIDGNEFFVLKKKEFNQEKYWIICKPLQGNELIKYMLEQKSVFDFKLVGEDAYEKFRIEKGIPAVPNEINDIYNPYEAGLINEVSFTKGCYIGQEVIARLETYDKVQKILSGVIFETQDVPSVSLLIIDGKNEVGKITSVAYSPLYKKAIGLTYLKKEYNNNGKVFVAKSEEGLEYPVTLTNLPFKR